MDAKKYFSSLITKESFSPQERQELETRLDPHGWLPLKEIEPRWEAIQGMCLQQKMPELVFALMPIIQEYRLNQAINLAKGANFRGGLTLEGGFKKFSKEVIGASEKIIEQRFSDITWASQKLSSDPKKISALFGQIVKCVPKVEEGAKKVVINVCRKSVENRSKSAYFAACKLLEYKVEINLKEVFESASYEQQKKLHKLGCLNLTRAFQLKFSFEKGELKKIHTFVGKVSLKDVKEAFSPCKDHIAVLAPFVIDALKKGESIDILLRLMNKGRISPFEDQLIATKQWDELIKLYALYSRADVQRFIDKLPEEVRFKAQPLAQKKGCLKALYEMKAVIDVNLLPKQPSLYRLGLLLLAQSNAVHKDVDHLIRTKAAFHPIIEEACATLKGKHAQKMLSAWPKLRKRQVANAQSAEQAVQLMKGAPIDVCLSYLNGNREQVLMELLRHRPVKDWDAIIQAFPEGTFPKEAFLKLACSRKGRLEFAIKHLGDDSDLIEALSRYSKGYYPENIVRLIEKTYEQIDPKRLPLNALVHYAGLVLKRGETKKFASTRRLIDCYKGSKSAAAAEVIRDVLPSVSKEAISLLNGLIFVAKDPLSALKGSFASKGLTEDQLLIRTTLLANACPIDHRSKKRISAQSVEQLQRELFRHQGHCVALLQDYMKLFTASLPLVKLYVQEVGASDREPDEKVRILRKFFLSDHYEKNTDLQIRDVAIACDLLHAAKAPRFVQVAMVALYVETAFNLQDPSVRPRRQPKQDLKLVDAMIRALPALYQRQLLPQESKQQHPDFGLCMAFYGADIMEMVCEKGESEISDPQVLDFLIKMRGVIFKYAPARANLEGAKYFDGQSVQFAQFLIANGRQKYALNICELYGLTRPFYGDVKSHLDVQVLLLDWSPKWGLILASRRSIFTPKGIKSFYELQQDRLVEALQKVLGSFTNEKDLDKRLDLLRRLKHSDFSEKFVALVEIDSWIDLYKTKSSWAIDHAFHYLIELQAGVELSEKVLIEGLSRLLSDKKRLDAVNSYKRCSTQELVKRGICALKEGGDEEITSLVKERKAGIIEGLQKELLPCVHRNLSAKKLRLLQQLLRFVGDPKVIFSSSIESGLNEELLRKSLALATLVIGGLQAQSKDWRGYHKEVCLALFKHYPQYVDTLLAFMEHSKDDALLDRYLLVFCQKIPAPWAVEKFLKLIRCKEGVLDRTQVCGKVTIALRRVKTEHDRARLLALLVTGEQMSDPTSSKFLVDKDQTLLKSLAPWIFKLLMHDLSMGCPKGNHMPLYISALFNYNVRDLSSMIPLPKEFMDEGELCNMWLEKEAYVRKLPAMKPYIEDKKKSAAISCELDSARVKIALIAPLNEAWKLRTSLKTYYGDPDLWWQLEYKLWKEGKHIDQLSKEAKQPRIWHGQKLISLQEHNSERLKECMRLKETK